MKKIILILFCSLAFTTFSQDPSFSQADLGSIYMNPAYAGASGHPKFLSIRREQWKNYNIPSDISSSAFFIVLTSLQMENLMENLEASGLLQRH